LHPATLSERSDFGAQARTRPLFRPVIRERTRSIFLTHRLRR